LRRPLAFPARASEKRISRMRPSRRYGLRLPERVTEVRGRGRVSRVRDASRTLCGFLFDRSSWPSIQKSRRLTAWLRHRMFCSAQHAWSRPSRGRYCAQGVGGQKKFGAAEQVRDRTECVRRYARLSMPGSPWGRRYRIAGASSLPHSGYALLQQEPSLKSRAKSKKKGGSKAALSLFSELSCVFVSEVYLPEAGPIVACRRQRWALPKVLRIEHGIGVESLASDAQRLAPYFLVKRWDGEQRNMAGLTAFY
jgi:hypothetical protein